MDLLNTIRAEIERQLSVAKSPEIRTIKAEDKMYRQGWTDLCEDLLIFLDTLEAEKKEVDLEKELKNERTKLLDAFGPMNGEQCLAIRNFARHFYELGLNARKK